VFRAHEQKQNNLSRSPPPQTTNHSMHTRHTCVTLPIHKTERNSKTNHSAQPRLWVKSFVRVRSLALERSVTVYYFKSQINTNRIAHELKRQPSALKNFIESFLPTSSLSQSRDIHAVLLPTLTPVTNPERTGRPLISLPRPSP
jgi:hypothetical protein